MQLAAEREQIVRYGREMLDRGLTHATGGNLSMIDRSRTLVAISPSGIDYREVTPAQVPVVDLSGRMIAGSAAPSSELAMHLAVYRQRDDLHALVHTHSVYAATLACMERAIPPVHYLIGMAGGTVRCAPYATFGTPALARAALAGMAQRKAVLLARHGVLAGEVDLPRALDVAETVEYCARIYYQCLQIGDPEPLDDDAMAAVMEQFAGYGRQDVQTPD